MSRFDLRRDDDGYLPKGLDEDYTSDGDLIQPQQLLAETCWKGRLKVSTVDYC